MRAAHLLAAAVLTAGLTACSDAGPDSLNGDGLPTTGPTSTAGVEGFPLLPPGEEFDPEGYEPEGDRDPSASPSPGFPLG